MSWQNATVAHHAEKAGRPDALGRCQALSFPNALKQTALSIYPFRIRCYNRSLACHCKRFKSTMF